MILRPPAGLDDSAKSNVEAVLQSAPPLAGRAIKLSFLPDLRTQRGKLVSGSAVGQEVHAAADLRRRLIVVDQALTSDLKELRRILLHEIFHFVWRRLSTPARRGYEKLIAKELERRARGELGWSSEMRKRKLTPSAPLSRSRRWREYLCESFCDSASWVYSDLPDHAEYTLAPRFRRARHEWLTALLSHRDRIPV